MRPGNAFGRAFSFLHASNFHLEQMPRGLDEIPVPLSAAFLEAPYAAATAVFDAALAREVDFVVLSGDLVDCRLSGPRGPVFLAEQFARLNEANIEVYWASGGVDFLGDWPARVALPENVHRFAVGNVEELILHRDGEPLVCLAGISRPAEQHVPTAEFRPDPAGLYTVAAVHGAGDVRALGSSRIHYWALGGRANPETREHRGRVIHFSGSPQGREPGHAGPHGATIVRVDENYRTVTETVHADAVRWLWESIRCEDGWVMDDLELAMHERVNELRDAHPSCHLCISWRVAGDAPVVESLRQVAGRDEILLRLRSEFGENDPVAWSVSVESERSRVYADEELAESTFLGEYLREAHEFSADHSRDIDLLSQVDPSFRETWRQLAAADSPRKRRRVLDEVAATGGELLHGRTSR
ncbi:MAG: hypothetical protein MPJ50_03070 [Pirellulales bacterium]|nr:hypothetical protein [Pirellulales bacterium]